MPASMAKLVRRKISNTFSFVSV